MMMPIVAIFMDNMRTLVIGDIHGRYEALRCVLDRSGYDPEYDRLISLGDEVDGGPDSYKVIDYLAALPNVISVRSNHMDWWMNYIKTTVELPIWTAQGGRATLWSYECENRGKIPIRHAEYAHKAIPYYIDSKNRIFIHGGFVPNAPLETQDIETFIWDRQLIEYARNNVINDFNHVFVGHTTTVYYHSLTPLTFNNLTMMDTGAGWPGGKLSVMDVDTREIWQSDIIEGEIIETI